MNRIVLEVSHSFQTGLSSGIQRVVRETIKNFEKAGIDYRLIWHPFGSKEGFQDVTDFYGSETDSPNDFVEFGKSFVSMLKRNVQNRKVLRLLRKSAILKIVHDKFLLKFLRSKGLREFVPRQNDSILLIDVFWNDRRILEALETLSSQKISINLFVHDIFPITFPDWFEKRSVELFKHSFHKALCISGAVITPSIANRTAIASYMESEEVGISNKHIFVAELGTDHMAIGEIDNQNKDRIGLVWLSTIEPRKNIGLLLDFLASTDLDLRVTVIGRIGWKSDSEISRLEKLEKLGKLKWMNNASDKDLIEVLLRSSIGVVTSENEGFGFTVYEFIKAGLKVVAPDIPIFREIKTESINFFKSNDFESFSEILLKTIQEGNLQPMPNELPTWKNFISKLLDIIG